MLKCKEDSVCVCDRLDHVLGLHSQVEQTSDRVKPAETQHPMPCRACDVGAKPIPGLPNLEQCAWIII